MKTLYLLRHAKAGFDLTGQADAERVLTHSGKQDAIKLGYKLKGRNAAIERFFCSPAVRTRQTLEAMLDSWGEGTHRVEILPPLYQASEQTVLHLVQILPNDVQEVMFIGHNPSMTQLSNLLALDLRLDHLPTCGLMVLQFECTNWQDIVAQSGKVAWFDFPKSDHAII